MGMDKETPLALTDGKMSARAAAAAYTGKQSTQGNELHTPLWIADGEMQAGLEWQTADRHALQETDWC
jgi:hypothetical protein